MGKKKYYAPQPEKNENIQNEESKTADNEDSKLKGNDTKGQKTGIKSNIKVKQNRKASLLKQNRRMRRETRVRLVEALATQTVVKEDAVTPEFSCNWKVLQEALNVETGGSRKRLHSSSSIDNCSASKKQRHDFFTTEEPNTDALLAAALKQQKISQSSSSSSSGRQRAWFHNVDPFLLEDDIVAAVDSDRGDDSSDEAVEVDMDQLGIAEHRINNKERKIQNGLVQKKKNENLRLPAIALDCEMVGSGPAGSTSMLARVSLVDQHGHALYDKYVLPVEPVTDYRTTYSGIRPEDLLNGLPFKQVQEEVAELLKGRLLIGHALTNDMSCLLLSHPRHLIRDTSLYQPFRALYHNHSPSLKKLAQDLLGVTIQEGEHDSVTDAHAAMRLYAMQRDDWELVMAGGKGRAQIRRTNSVGVKRFKGMPCSIKRRRENRTKRVRSGSRKR